MYGQKADFSGWLCDFGYSMPGPLGMIFTILIWAAVILVIIKIVQSLFQGDIRKGSNKFRFILDANLPKGLYFIEVKDNGRRYFIKLLRN